MSNRREFLKTGVLAALGSGILANTAFGQEAKGTAENLQTAFNGESNAKNRYEAFAVKADEEGYHQAASLFRAAALSETFHARNHAVVIFKMGAGPKATIQPPDVKSTRENVEAALKGEDYERLTMYPAFVKQAEADKNTDATESFEHALAAETQHAKYYKEALENLDAWKEGAKDFLVCSNCGYTTTDLSLKMCPICGFPRSAITRVK
jgi:rubrerythrin